MSLKRDIEWFISKSKSIHGDRFDYSNSVYINAITKIEIRCIKHNNIFYQLPRNHFNAPNSCKDCKFEKNSRPHDTNKFIKKAKKVHGERYNYSKVNYINGNTDVIIICKKHGDFLQKPNNHLNGGCYKCGVESSHKRKPPKGRSLAEVNPELAKQWHPTKNGDLTPNDVFAKSRKNAWWKCPKAEDHVWEANIGNRNKGVGCAVCAGYIVVKSNCLATHYPRIAKEWHPTKNGNLTPYDVTPGNNQKVWWKCDKVDDHEWEATINSRSSGNGCSVCHGRTIVTSNSLAILRPELAKEWHPTKNGDLTPFDFSEYSAEIVWWKCNKGDDHEWQSAISNRASGNGCSVCHGLTVVESNCLATIHPKLSKQWHPTKNGDLTPFDVTVRSNHKIWWKCDKGDDHEWKALISSRTSYNTQCPYCTLTPQSRQELTITFELIQFFKDINPKGFKTRVNGKLWSIDIYIPQLKLGIEFDGSYWHKDKRALDKLKTENLEEEGFKIFRVREEPLKRIFDDDIMSKQPFNAKQVTNDILTQIMSRYTLDAKKIAKIESYISKKEVQNEKGLDKYIDMILTEKAEKKK